MQHCAGNVGSLNVGTNVLRTPSICRVSNIDFNLKLPSNVVSSSQIYQKCKDDVVAECRIHCYDKSLLSDNDKMNNDDW